MGLDQPGVGEIVDMPTYGGVGQPEPLGEERGGDGPPLTDRPQHPLARARLAHGIRRRLGRSRINHTSMLGNCLKRVEVRLAQVGSALGWLGLIEAQQLAVRPVLEDPDAAVGALLDLPNPRPQRALSPDLGLCGRGSVEVDPQQRLA